MNKIVQCLKCGSKNVRGGFTPPKCRDCKTEHWFNRKTMSYEPVEKPPESKL